LTNVTLQQNSGLFFVAGGGSWGNNESNGGQVTFTAYKQTMSGEIQVDYISQLSLYLMNNSYFTGTINQMYNAQLMVLMMDASSTWNVTGTSYLTSLSGDNGNMSNIIGNGFTVYYYYNANGNSGNTSILQGQTYNLTNGGYLKPIMETYNKTVDAFVPSSGVQSVNDTTTTSYSSTITLSSSTTTLSSSTTTPYASTTIPYASTTIPYASTTILSSSTANIIKDRPLFLAFTLGLVTLFTVFIIS
jgi:hypothetical protein